MTTEVSSKTTRLIPIGKWNEFHAWPPQGGLRHLVFYANTNGFDKVIRRVGRRILIDENSYFEWIAEKIRNKKGR
jgi:hypothetical protein